jgi:hypothetical protein
MRNATLAMAFVLSASGAWAQKPTGGAAAPASAVPKPPDWSAWKWVMGSWKCSGTMAMGGAQADVKLTINNKLEMDNFFVMQTGSAAKAKDNPFGGLRWVAYWTLDPSGMRYTVVDNQGSVETGSGPAWSDNYEFTGQATSPAGKTDVKHTWKKVSDKEFHWSETMGGPPGLSWDWTCKKG